MRNEDEWIEARIRKPIPVEQIGSIPANTEDDVRYGLADKKLDDWVANADETHKRNLPAIESNKEQAAALSLFLGSLGLTGYSEVDRKSRTRWPKTIHHGAGYIDDISRSYVTSDGYQAVAYEQANRKLEISRIRERLEIEKRASERKMEDSRRASESLISLGKMCGKYSVECSDWDEMLEALCAKSKYLRLGVGGYLTCCDWNDGPYRARGALNEFTVDNDADRAVAEEWERLLEDFEDGRCFRDCEHSYDYLFSLVDPDLMADARKALEYAVR